MAWHLNNLFTGFLNYFFFLAQPGVHNEFQNSQSYIVRLHLLLFKCIGIFNSAPGPGNINLEEQSSRFPRKGTKPGMRKLNQEHAIVGGIPMPSSSLLPAILPPGRDSL